MYGGGEESVPPIRASSSATRSSSIRSLAVGLRETVEGALIDGVPSKLVGLRWVWVTVSFRSSETVDCPALGLFHATSNIFSDGCVAAVLASAIGGESATKGWTVRAVRPPHRHAGASAAAAARCRLRCHMQKIIVARIPMTRAPITAPTIAPILGFERPRAVAAPDGLD